MRRTTHHALQVAPTYDAATDGRPLAALTAAFAELREMADRGAIS